MTSGSARRARGRLRWKGLEVSDEFRRYADRVARGEDLPPFQGSILAEPDPAFPWDPNEQRHAQGRALKRQFGLWTGVALFLGLCVWVLVVQVGNQTDPAQKAAESPLATVVLGNQPVVAPPLDVAAADPRAATAAQAEDTETSAATADQGTTALASLQERTAAPSVPAAPAPAASAPRAVAASSNPSAASAVAPASAAGAIVTMRSTAAAPPASKANVLEITRTPPGALDVAASSSDRVPGAGSTSTAGAAGGVAAASPGTATASPIAASPIAASPAPAASAPADPKKEPGREASTMGPLLVEKPSF
jgi:hypothetical protein